MCRKLGSFGGCLLPLQVLAQVVISEGKYLMGCELPFFRILTFGFLGENEFFRLDFTAFVSRNYRRRSLFDFRLLLK